jgi:hypothetical protein
MKRIILLLVISLAIQNVFAENPDYELLLTNDIKTSDHEMEFDIMIHPKSPTVTFELASLQAIMTFNVGISGGALTLSVVNGTSELAATQQPTTVQISGSELRVSPRTPPGAGSGTIINDYKRVVRLKISSTTPFTPISPEIMWKNSGSNPVTKVNGYVDGLNTVITNTANHINDLTNSPLPVELTSFKAKQDGEGISLSWETKTEINNYGFEIERSQTSNVKSEVVWKKIGFVEGNGNSNSTKNYSFTDKSPRGGSKFQYRLKQLDTDGKYTYSDVEEVEYRPTKFELFQNYPNPFNPATKIEFELPQEGNVTLKVYNTLGEEVAILINRSMEAGAYTFNFNANGLSNGIYIYQLRTNNVTLTKKMVLMK